jgi:hypothetical protein
METQYTWASRFFRRTLDIMKYEEPAGELKSMTWKRRSEGQLNGRKVNFEIRGFFGKDFLILNPDDNNQIGSISFNTWRTKATITLKDRNYNWEYENFWHSKWHITNENGNLVQYASGFKRGEILSYTDDDVLILTGLYIRDYLQQRASESAASASAAT